MMHIDGSPEDIICNLWENFLPGSLETAKSEKPQPASEASVVVGPNNNKNSHHHHHHHNKTGHVCSSTHKHAHRTNQTDKASRRSFWAARSGGKACPLARGHGSPVPSPPPSVISALPTVSVPTQYTEANK
ncbi:lateral signaling target protein 2 homolog [Mustela erminea]|uniref:lateral signaling target protein 2 homolog n=1 Tax=Mustela erminea TaxID=36723 RepID=UPI001386DD17|nr:lateral signaling target protein 2 homolog [Mustela erminea]